jgi:hypothetical protein
MVHGQIHRHPVRHFPVGGAVLAPLRVLDQLRLKLCQMQRGDEL